MSAIRNQVATFSFGTGDILVKEKNKRFCPDSVCNHLAQLSFHCASSPPSTQHPESDSLAEQEQSQQHSLWSEESSGESSKCPQRAPPPLCYSSLLGSAHKQDGNLNQKGKLDLYNNLKITLYKAAKHIFLSAKRKMLTRNTVMW